MTQTTLFLSAGILVVSFWDGPFSDKLEQRQARGHVFLLQVQKPSCV